MTPIDGRTKISTLEISVGTDQPIGRLRAGILGALMGNALGVPHEFKPPDALPSSECLNLVMPQGYLKTYMDIPYGTWSEDGSELLCLLDSLVIHHGILSLDDFGRRLLCWRNRGLHQSGGKAFDCDFATESAIHKLETGVSPESSGETEVATKGNENLSRVLPVALLPFQWGMVVAEAHATAMRQSCLTHAHPLSQVCCALYIQLALELVVSPDLSLDEAIALAFEVVRESPALASVDKQRAIDEVERHGAEEMPISSGYVVDLFWTTVWALQQSDSYLDTVRAAISLGIDTQTAACASGGLAGILYGLDDVPPKWWTTLRIPAESMLLLDSLRP